MSIKHPSNCRCHGTNRIQMGNEILDCLAEFALECELTNAFQKWSRELLIEGLVLNRAEVIKSDKPYVFVETTPIEATQLDPRIHGA